MVQTSIFDFLKNDYKITKPIRLIELFAGIGSQAKALKNIGANFEHYKVVEFDKYAIASYNAIHGTNFETSDITKIAAKELEIEDTEHYTYIMTYSFPCQDLSIAGKQKGMSKDSGTRSGLLWEVERILDECSELPQVILMENVPQVIGAKHIDDFNEWQLKLESLGYSNFVEILNAKDYGIPQNRGRCFMVSILGEYNYSFPKPINLELKLKDMLEDEVDEKYYLSEKMLECFMSNGTGKYPRRERFLQNMNRPNQDIANSITTNSNTRPTDNFVGNIKTICLNSKGGRNGTEGLQPSVNDRIYDSNGIAACIATSNFFMPNYTDGLGIRKLIPKECFRVMGFSDDDYERAAKVNIDTQLYKQAGNSIVVNVLEEIFKQLLA